MATNVRYHGITRYVGAYKWSWPGNGYLHCCCVRTTTLSQYITSELVDDVYKLAYNIIMKQISQQDKRRHTYKENHVALKEQLETLKKCLVSTEGVHDKEDLEEVKEDVLWDSTMENLLSLK